MGTPLIITEEDSTDRFFVKAIYAEGTCKADLQVRTEGNRRVLRSIHLYRLDAILADGYRVRSPRGVRQRVTATLDG